MGLIIFKQFYDASLMFCRSKFQKRVKDKKEEKRWRLFHATDFQSLMYPCFAFCRILGIFPYKINTSSYEISKPCYILSTVVTCVVCFYTIFILYLINNDLNSKWFKIKGLRRNIELSIYYIFSGFIVVVTYVWNGPRMRLFQTILKISSGLPLESYQKQSMIIHTKDIAAFFFTLMQQSTCLFVTSYPIWLEIFSIYITLVMFQMDMLYMNCICVLKACFKRINDSLVNLLVINNKPHLFRRNYHEQRNLFLLMELKALKKQYLVISNTMRILNMTFNLQLLATVVVTFVRITFFSYFCLILWNDMLHLQLSNLEQPFLYIFFITSIVFYFIKMALMTWACKTGKDQAIEIGITVHDVFNSTYDEQIKNELQLFSLQILHTRRNTFSAKGLTMDAPFFAGLMGGITTYLLILIQFLYISNSCDK